MGTGWCSAMPEPMDPISDDETELRDRCTAAELAEREAAALELLAQGTGTALSAHLLVERYGVSLRQARRYVRLAALELLEPLTTAELDAAFTVDLHRLELISGRAMVAGDDATAIRATRAHAAALTQFRRAIAPPSAPRRIDFRTASTKGDPPF